VQTFDRGVIWVGTWVAQSEAKKSKIAEIEGVVDVSCRRISKNQGIKRNQVTFYTYKYNNLSKFGMNNR
jgi:hypothetical protein